MAYIMIGEQPFRVDTDEQLEEARAALCDACEEEADVFEGDPDGLGDSYRNGRKVFVGVCHEAGVDDAYLCRVVARREGRRSEPVDLSSEDAAELERLAGLSSEELDAELVALGVDPTAFFEWARAFVATLPRESRK